ncbi:MAG: hypothetical protein GC191_20135 [Azospirillum sp.]|nr:hypothetical protein [Azospirillum sp.]
MKALRGLVLVWPVSASLLSVYGIACGFARFGIPIFDWRVSVHLPSGDGLSFGLDFALIFLALALYPIEAWKATRVGKPELYLETLASMASMLTSLIMFLLTPGFGTTTVLIILTAATVDVVNAFVIGITAARRDVNMSASAAGMLF